jgi:hypothetical protein
MLIAFGILFFLFTGLGVAIDRLLVMRHRSALHTAMVHWWNMIDDTAVPELPTLAARRLLRFGRFLFPWKLASWQTVIAAIIVSWCLTTAAFLVGSLIDGEPWQKLPSFLPLATVYIANFPFDLLTFIAAVWSLQVLRTSRGAWFSITSIAITVLVAAALAILSFASIFWANDFAVRHHFPAAAEAQRDADIARRKEIENQLGAAYGDIEETKISQELATSPLGFWKIVSLSPARMLQQLRYGTASVSDMAIVTAHPIKDGQLGPPEVKVLTFPIKHGWGPMLIAISTFLPLMGYMAMLMILLLAKLVLKVVRGVVLYTLELLTQHDPIREPKEFMPFTIVGTALGAIVTTVRAIVMLIESSHH